MAYQDEARTMQKTKLKIFVIVFMFLMLVTGLSLTTWKLFSFRSELNSIIEREQWEKSLASNGIYSNNVILFFGDSQIRSWSAATSFGVLPIVNKGKYGDWATKAINRFENDIISLNPKMAVLLIGTNDLSNGQTVSAISSSIDIMLKIALNKNINVILCSLLPVRYEHSNTRSPKDIIQINNNLAILAQKYKIDYVDFYSRLVDKEGLFKVEYTSDGLHPNKSGYIVMSKIIFPHLIKFIAQKSTQP
jgi:lysophospholipase L1-like esterase